MWRDPEGEYLYRDPVGLFRDIHYFSFNWPFTLYKNIHFKLTHLYGIYQTNQELK
jgi:hypothetical protein